MTELDAILDLSFEELEQLLAKDDIPLDVLTALLARTSDPDKVKIVVAALNRAMAREAAEAKRMEDGAERLSRDAQATRARIQRAEEVIRELSERLEAEQSTRRYSP